MVMAETKDDDFDDDFLERLDLNEKIEKATEITFRRLRQLVQRGYKPDLNPDWLTGIVGGGVEGGAIWLYHPRESWKHKHLCLIHLVLLSLPMHTPTTTALVVMKRSGLKAFFGLFPSRHSGNLQEQDG
jgi:hypothetical protein